MVPAQTPSDALQQFKEVRDTLNTQRSEIAARLDHESLFELWLKLCTKHGIENSLLFSSNPDNASSELFPIELVPVYEDWINRCKQGFADAESEQAVKFGESLAAAKAEMGARWKDGAIDAREWLCSIIDSQIKTAEAEMLLRAWFDHVTVGDILSMDSEDRNADHGNIDEKQLRKYYEGFAIGDKLPEFMQNKLDQRFTERWPEGRQLKDWQKIIGVNAWGAFWQKFGGHYLAGRNELAGATAAIKRTRKSAGEEGSVERTRSRYIKFTQSFVQWLNKRPVTLDLIKAFPKQEDVSLLKGREFLGVLFTAKQNPGTRGDMEGPLSNSDIRLSQTDADVCFGILFRREIPEPKKKVKK